METNFNFKSAICTSREQSERLLALGLKKETADMYQVKRVKDYEGNDIPDIWQSWTASFHGVKVGPGLEEYVSIPAWSLHRLIEMMPHMIGCLELAINGEFVGYYEDRCESETGMYWEHTEECSNLYDNIISTIKWLIKEGYFPKEYLV